MVPKCMPLVRLPTARAVGMTLLAMVASLFATMAMACPNPGANGQMLSYTGQQLWAPQSHGVVAGGGQDLGACPNVPGSGRVTNAPDFTLDLTQNIPGYDLEFRVQGQCDTVLLINGPNGQWHYNDDDSGVDPRIRLQNAATGQYDIWVGTYAPGNCQATLVAETFGGGGLGMPQPLPFPQPLPLPLPIPQPLPAACPNPGANGQMLTYTGQQLWAPQSHGVTAGGPLDLGACGAVPGHGHIVQNPDFTLNLAQNIPGYDLEFRVQAQCDTVLLVNGPNGQWHYNDDTNGTQPAIRLNGAAVGQYDIWVGTFGANTCQATLQLETFGGGGLPQPLPLPLPLPQPLPAACPNPAANGQMLTYTGQQLWAPQSHGVTAGGPLDLGACGAVPGHGHIVQNPDFTLNLAQNIPGYDLEFRVQAQCDTILLVNGPNGQWHYNDDTNGTQPAIRLNGAAVGQYDIWVGTFGANTCQATLQLETFGGQAPQPQPQPQPVLCPDPNLTGQLMTYSAHQLRVEQSRGVVAGGGVDLAACPGVPGHGRVIQSPDFTLNLSANAQGRALEFRVTGQCDTVLLVNGPNGQWHYNDDTNGVNPLIRLNNAAVGQYGVWVGTFGQANCQASLAVETFGAVAPPQPQPPAPQPPAPLPVVCPNPSAHGAPLAHSVADLQARRSYDVVAGGPSDLASCPGIPGNGHTIQSPDFSLQINGDPSGQELLLGVDAACDTVLLVNDPNGRWHYNDDGLDLSPRLTLSAPVTGTWRIWVGTFGPATCPASLSVQMQPVAPPVELAPANMTGYRNRVGQSFAFQVTGAAAGALWGSGVYTDDSSVARAAVHAGLLQPGQTGVLTLQVLAGQDAYPGSLQNGVQSSTYGRWNGSFAFVEGPGASRPEAAGIWQILANGFPGALVLDWDGAAWSGSLTFASFGIAETLEAISYDPATGIVEFTRPIPGGTQVYSGTLTAGQFSGSFSQGGGDFLYPWSAMP